MIITYDMFSYPKKFDSAEAINYTPSLASKLPIPTASKTQKATLYAAS